MCGKRTDLGRPDAHTYITSEQIPYASSRLGSTPRATLTPSSIKCAKRTILCSVRGGGGRWCAHRPATNPGPIIRLSPLLPCIAESRRASRWNGATWPITYRYTLNKSSLFCISLPNYVHTLHLFFYSFGSVMFERMSIEDRNATILSSTTMPMSDLNVATTSMTVPCKPENNIRSSCKPTHNHDFRPHGLSTPRRQT